MADINITKDSKFIKVLAAQAKRERIDSAVAQEASDIVKEQATDFSTAKREQLAQTMAYTVDELQGKALDFVDRIADVKNVAYGDKAVFDIKTKGIKAVIQAKGATTPRSYVAGRQVAVETHEVSARPAINIVDLRYGRVNMADLIREANNEMTAVKIGEIEKVLHGAIDDYQTPFYATGTGIVKATLDGQLNYFRRLGAITILGDQAAIAQMTGITGVATNAGGTLIVNPSNNMIDEANQNGYLGRYNGCDLLVLQNGYHSGTTDTILNPNWLYILPVGATNDMRNLKVVNEGGVYALESQNIDDMVFEVRLDQWFGAAFVRTNLPNMGAYLIG